MRQGAHAHGTSLARAADANRIHYAVMLMRRDLLDDLALWRAEGGRSVQSWQARHAPTEVVFTEPDCAFLNVNTPEDLARARGIAAG
jgi:molybdopterin-guanine dinucleotide biosynthesis protein A